MIYIWLSFIEIVVRVSSLFPFFLNFFCLMLPFTCNRKKSFILFGSHLAYLSNFFSQNEAISWLADLFIIAPEERIESWAAGVYQAFIYFLSPCFIFYYLHFFHILKRPSTHRLKVDYVRRYLRFKGAT